MKMDLEIEKAVSDKGITEAIKLLVNKKLFTNLTIRELLGRLFSTVKNA